MIIKNHGGKSVRNTGSDKNKGETLKMPPLIKARI